MRYGQRPDAVKKWSADEFDEAVIILLGEQPYKVTESEIKDDLKSRGLNEDSFLQGKSKEYWNRFIVDGVLDESSLSVKAKTPERVAYLKTEILRRGWASPAN